MSKHNNKTWYTYYVNNSGILAVDIVLVEKGQVDGKSDFKHFSFLILYIKIYYIHLF